MKLVHTKLLKCQSCSLLSVQCLWKFNYKLLIFDKLKHNINITNNEMELIWWSNTVLPVKIYNKTYILSTDGGKQWNSIAFVYYMKHSSDAIQQIKLLITDQILTIEVKSYFNINSKRVQYVDISSFNVQNSLLLWFRGVYQPKERSRTVITEWY